MKKILTLFLCAAAALSMTACNADKEALNSGTGVRSEGNVSSNESIFSEESISSDNGVSFDVSDSSDVNASSEERTEYKSLTILGDSIASGCMLPQYEAGNNYSTPLSFGNMLGAEFESYNNFAVDGRTTEELLNALRSSEDELAEAVSNSDVMVISIGGNDFLQPMISAMMSNSELIASIFMEGYQSNMSSMPDLSNIMNEFTQKIMDSVLEAAKKVDVEKTLDNISECVKLISDVNPNTEIILMTVYNPFPGNDLLNAASGVAQEQLSLLNSGITALQGGKVSVIDVYGAFDGKADKYTNIGIMDVHPNADGHYKIYQLLKKQLKIDD